MKLVQLDLYPDTLIRCPFCGAVVFDKEGAHACPHVLFHTNDFGQECVREDLKTLRAYPDMLITREWLEQVDIVNAFVFELVNPNPPGMCMGGFTHYIALCQDEKDD